MKISRQVVYNLNEIIEEFKPKIVACEKFNYMLKKNRDKFKSILNKIPRYAPPDTKEYEKYLESVKNKMKAENLKFQSAEEMNNFYQTEIESHPEAKLQREEGLKEFREKTMKWEVEEVEVELYTIDISLFPDGLTFEQYESLSEFFSIPEVEEIKEEAKEEVKVEKPKKK